MPLAISKVEAGFPSPAEDYEDMGIDLNKELIINPICSFFLRVSGCSMTNAGIQDGDLLIVDRSIDPRPGNVVVALLDGSFTLKRLINKDGITYLKSDNPNYPLINTKDYESIQIWGVATYSIHKLKCINKY